MKRFIVGFILGALFFGGAVLAHDRYGNGYWDFNEHGSGLIIEEDSILFIECDVEGWIMTVRDSKPSAVKISISNLDCEVY